MFCLVWCQLFVNLQDDGFENDARYFNTRVLNTGFIIWHSEICYCETSAPTFLNLFLLFHLHFAGWAWSYRETQGSHVRTACREEMANLLQQKEGKQISVGCIAHYTVSAFIDSLLSAFFFCFCFFFLFWGGGYKYPSSQFYVISSLIDLLIPWAVCFLRLLSLDPYAYCRPFYFDVVNMSLLTVIFRTALWTTFC